MKKSDISMDISAPLDEIWHGLPRNARTMVRKGHKQYTITKYSNPTRHVIQTWHVFYASRMKHKGVRVYSLKEFNRLLDNPATILYTIEKGGEIIGGAIVTHGDDRVIPLHAAMMHESLLWQMIKDYKAIHGCSVLSLGASQVGSNTYKFKKHFTGKFTIETDVPYNTSLTIRVKDWLKKCLSQ